MWSLLKSRGSRCIKRGVCLIAAGGLMGALSTLLWMPLPAVVDDWGFFGNWLIGFIPMCLGPMVVYCAYQFACGQQTRSEAFLNLLALVTFIAGYVALLIAVPS